MAFNVFELFATLGLDSSEYEEGLGKAEGLAGKFGSGVAKMAGMAGKATVASIATATTAVAGLTKKSVDYYGEYEQMVGGVEKLFGDSADTVMKYSENAYKTAGMSANDYLESVTSFSAALIQGLDGDTEEAARIADLALTDMSDNFNTFGGDIGMVQNTYNGLMRQNFMMLDNLKLGYQGTAAEMARLINDSGVMGDEFVATADNVKDISFDKYIEAIHVIQSEMNISGITAEEAAEAIANGTMTEEEAMKAMGTTAREAQTTLQGSFQTLSASWTNLVTGLSDPDADIGQLIENFVTSAKNALGNLVPVITQALTSISQVITQLAPVIAEELPTLVQNVLPNLLTAVTTLVETAVTTISTVLPVLIEQLLPTLISAGITLITSLVSALPQILNILTAALPQVFGMLIPAILGVLPTIIVCVVELVMAIATALSDNAQTIVDAVVALIETLVTTLTTPENLTQLINVAITLIETLATALIEATPRLIAMIPIIFFSLCEALYNNMDSILIAIGHILVSIGKSLFEGIGALMGMSKQEVDDSLTAIGEVFLNGLNSMGEFFSSFGETLVTGVTTVWESVTTLFSDGMESAKTFVSDGLDGLSQLFTDIWDTIKTTVSTGIDAVLELFDFEWSLPDLKLPHLSVTGGEAPYGIGGKGSLPTFDIEWYAKAYDDAYMLNDATIFGMSGGNLLGGGEKNGGEMIVGEQYFRDVMIESASRIQIQPIVRVVIGGEELDSFTTTSEQRISLIGGGRA